MRGLSRGELTVLSIVLRLVGSLLELMKGA